ncbi:hypothetical protein AVEN_199703-2 [Araneus ventricosus]|uniref:Uncharacterized protein n=1 Tax=Araneus ventricosus TaxID=182803 RepID=A0A4Y2GZS3_ARAVE|nr:hypothetical protein AVEN_199703-2 [Araneus ventricosus]
MENVVQQFPCVGRSQPFVCNSRKKKTIKKWLPLSACMACLLFGMKRIWFSSAIYEENAKVVEMKYNIEMDFERLLYYVQHPKTLCYTALSLGGNKDAKNRTDGDKIICQDQAPPLRPPCLVYSFGKEKYDEEEERESEDDTQIKKVAWKAAEEGLKTFTKFSETGSFMAARDVVKLHCIHKATTSGLSKKRSSTLDVKCTLSTRVLRWAPICINPASGSTHSGSLTLTKTKDAALDSRQLENVKGELLYLTKKETADCELCHNVARTEKTEEQNNNRFTVMAHCGQKRRADKQRNSRLSDMPQRGQERKVEETEEQRNSRLVRQDVSRDLRE